MSGAFFICTDQCRSGMDCIHRTGIHTSATVDTGIGIDCALATLFADGVHGTGILACSTVCAIIGNGMSHDFTSL